MTPDTIQLIESLDCSIDQFKLAKTRLNFRYDCFYESARGYAGRKIARRLLYRLGEAQRYLPILESRRTIMLNRMGGPILEAAAYQQLLNDLEETAEATNTYIEFLHNIFLDPAQVLKYADVQEMDLMSQDVWLWVI
jgi:hypothetical protein